MRLSILSFITLVACSTNLSLGFAPAKFSYSGVDTHSTFSKQSPQVQSRGPINLYVDNESSMAVPKQINKSKAGRGKSLGLITFDLDDTLFPIAAVIDEADEAFSRAMAKFGYEGIDPRDITFTSKSMREDENYDEDGNVIPLTYTEMRLRAIRYEMERFITFHKLEQIAAGTATTIDSLHPTVVASAEMNAKRAVHSSVVQMVYNAWELERHYSAERNLYPDALEMLKRIRSFHPGVVIGAITDGKGKKPTNNDFYLPRKVILSRD
jgi:FMN phosphatase YigB (HAD superfamily)